MNTNGNTGQACLLLGSNISPERNLPMAIELLRCHVEVSRASRVWESPAVGSPGPNFRNAAVLARTHLEPDELKRLVLSAIEQDLGRVRTADKYAPRPIDIDIVAWNGEVTDPDVWRYAHAAVPVAEVLPGDLHPEQGETLTQVAARLSQSTPIRLVDESPGDYDQAGRVGL